MDPTCGLADKFRDLVLAQIWEQLLYLASYHRNIEKLNQGFDELTVKRSSIQHRIDEARNNVEEIEQEVSHCLLEMDKISQRARQFREEASQAETECSITSCPNPCLRYKLSKRAKAMAQEVADICGKANFDRVSYRLPPPSIPELPYGESNEGIDSRESIMKQIMEALRNPSVSVIGLCGLGGVGKTTIAKDIELKGKNQKMFEKVIWATVSNKLNVREIQCQIAEKLGMTLNEETVIVRAGRLWKRLEQEKNMLLILDDLWKELDLRDIGIPFVDVENYSKNNGCCKILLTSRDEGVLSYRMKCQKLIKVDILSDNEAFKLFERINGSISSELKSIAVEIVQRCRGLPLAIATAAKALQEKDADGWKDHLARFKSLLRRNITGIREVDASLKLSYDSLSRENKNIFLLSAMLSHDPSVVDLLMYSVGLDFLQGIENMEEAYVGISNIVRKLKSLNLFLDSFSNHRFTIHDAYRDVALSIASETLCAFIVRLKEWPEENRLEGYKGIYLEESDISIELPEELNAPSLQFFMLHSKTHDLTIPNTFFKSSKKLKLVAFTNLHFSLLPSLRFLQELRALCLHSCVLEDIDEVRSLKKLKVLSLAYSEIERLPIELVELTCLQMLNLSHCFKLRVIPEKLLSSFKKLEVLYMENSFNQWKEEANSEANENASLDELKDLPISSLDICIPNLSMLPENLFLHMNLKRYRILIGKRWKWWQCNHENSKTLRLELERGIHLKSGFEKLLEGVGDLYVYGSNGLDNVLYSHEGRGFPHLRHLRIENNDDIKYIVMNSAHHEAAFPALESLVLQDLKAFEKLCEGMNTIAFDKLRTLRMINLPTLTVDPYLKDGATNNISNKMFRSLFRKVVLPKLEILELCNLNNSIPFIWDGQLSHNSLSNLKTLTVKECGFVKLLPFHVLKSLNNLEELEIEGCRMLKMVFDFEDYNDYKEIEPSSMVVPLKRLKLWDLSKLKNLWSNHYQGNVSFPNLRSVEICYCESLTSIFPPSFILKGMLRNLEELQIWRCGINVIVANDQASEYANAAFECLRLTSLELDGKRKCPNLRRLYIKDCDKFKIFGKEVSGSLKIHEEESTLSSNYSLQSRHQIIPNLERLELGDKQAMINNLFPMYQFPKVKMLSLFLYDESTISYKSLCNSFPNLKQLQVDGDFEEALETDDVAASFSTLTLNNISNMRSLSPSLVSSQNLTHLQVEYCYNGLTTLMTSSTAKCLVHLTHLSIKSCYRMEEIVTKQEGKNDEDKEIIFSKLKVLEFINMPKLKRFCGYNYTFRFPLLEQITMKYCPKFKIFSPGNIHSPSLRSVQSLKDWRGKQHEIWDTNLDKTFYQQRFVASREVVLDKYDASMIRNGQFPVESCPHVEILDIEGLVDYDWLTLLERFPGLKEFHVNNCSFEEIFPSHAPSLASFHNLTKLKVSKCHQLVYLVTNLTAQILVNLETLEIIDCEKMEEIVKKESSEDVERGGIIFNGLRKLKLDGLPRMKTEDFSIKDRAIGVGLRLLFDHNQEVLPKLEELELSNLLNNSISLIWGEQLLHNSFSNLKTLIVKSCGSLKSVPIHVLKSLNKLEKLQVSGCHMLEMVFGFEDLNDCKDMGSASVVVPLNLTNLKVESCQGLTTLMTSSAARSLVHLTHLSISFCDQIKEIITKQEGEDEEDMEIVLSKLEILELIDLPRLKRFCSHNYTFGFSSLERTTIKKCPQLTMFCPGATHTPLLKKIQVGDPHGPLRYIWTIDLNDTLQYRFTIKEVISTMEYMALNAETITMIKDVFPKVRNLYVEGFMDEGITFPYGSLQRFPKLYSLYVEHCSFEEIFPSHDRITNDFIEEIPPFKDLFIAHLDKLKRIWKDDSQHPPIHQNLTSLEVNSCCNLLKLAPSFASFQYLWNIKVSRCHQLIHLVTSSTAKSLVSLGELEINDCKNMEEIVMNETNEDVEVAIIFNQLSKIGLTDMSSLKMFSSQSHTFKFPKLKELKITGCPEIHMFCPGVLKTPKLSKVKIEEHDIAWKDEEDLNKTIKILSLAKESVVNV